MMSAKTQRREEKTNKKIERAAMRWTEASAAFSPTINSQLGLGPGIDQGHKPIIGTEG
jgi:hypothetical protein